MTTMNRRSVLKGGTAATAGILLPMPFIHRAAAQETITIGVITPLSGPQQLIGNFVKIGAEIGADWVNANGGIGGKQVKLEFRDDKANPNDATVVTRELLGSGVTLTLGAIASPVALAMGPLMQQEGGVHLTAGAGTEKLNHENYNDHVFRVGDNPYTRNKGLVRQIIESHPEVSTWGGIIPDHEYGRTTWAIFVDAMLELYPEKTGNEPAIQQPILVPYGSGDYKNFIGQAARLEVGGFYTSVYGGDAVTLYQQARPFGLFDDKILVDSANEFLVATAMKDQIPVHWTGFHWYYETNKGNALSDNLYEEYVKRTGDKFPMGWAAEAQAGILAYKAAVEKTNGSTEAGEVIAALKGLTFDSATGPRTIRPEDNQAIKNVELCKLEPDAGSESGFKVSEYKQVDGAAIIEPPTPGKKLELRTL